MNNLEEKDLEEKEVEIFKKHVDNNSYQHRNNHVYHVTKKNNTMRNIVICLVLFFLGALLMYGIILRFPTMFTKEITENKVTITDTGIADAVDKIYDAVVIVSTYNEKGLISTGSGFVYKVEDGLAYILTNHHVIDGGSTVNVTFTDGSISTVDMVGSNEYEDVAVLTVPEKDVLKVAEMGNVENLRLGDTTFAVGGPLDTEYAWTVTRGILSGKDRMVGVTIDNADYYMNVIQTDTAINSGNSGGPLCNSNGEVIGITTLKLKETGIEGMGFAISIKDALEAADNIINNEDYETPYLGIAMYDLAIAYNPAYSEYTKYQEDIEKHDLKGGVIVTEVVEGSTAKKGGIEVGDLIYKFNDVEIESSTRLKYELYNSYIGNTIKINVIRDGKVKTLEFELYPKGN